MATRNRPRRQYYPQSGSGTVPYMSQFQPLPMGMLQQRLAEKDARWRQAQAQLSTADAALNKYNMYDKDRNALSQYIDKGVKDIQQMVEDEYSGDLGAAAEEVAGRMVEMRQPIAQAAQKYKEWQPVVQQARQARSRGLDVIDPKGVLEGGIQNMEYNPETGKLEDVGPEDMQMYYSDPSERNQYIKQSFSDAINRTIIPKTLQDAEMAGFAQFDQVQGMSDQAVQNYFDRMVEENPDRLINTIESGPSNFARLADQRFGPEWRDPNSEGFNQVKNLITGVVQNQTSQQLKRQYMNKPQPKTGSSTDVMDWGLGSLT